MHIVWRLALGGLFTAAAACGSSGNTSGDAGGGDTVTADQACTARAQAECARRDACSNHYLINRTYGDMATCVTRLHNQCVASLAAAGTGATPATTQACADGYPAIHCADYLNGVLPAVCLPPTGMGATGTACHFNAQCQSGQCSVMTGAACGTCAPVPTSGTACNGTGAIAGCGGRGLVCGGETATAPGACVSPVTLNGTCNAMLPCAAGLSCTPTNPAMPLRTCQTAGGTVGAACGGATSPGCDPNLGLACNSVSHTCQVITLVAPGTACGEGTQGGFAACSAGGDCMGYTAATPHGTCRLASADGAACDRANGPFCGTPSACVTAGTATTGTCTFPSATSCH